MSELIHQGLPAGTPVLVTGATGFTGKVLVRKLVEAGAQVRAIAREKSSISALDDLPVQWFRGQVYDADVVEQAVHGVDYIFNVAAAFREPGIEDEEYRRVHVVSTQLLAAAALKQPGFKRFVHTSTVGVHGHVGDAVASETFRYAPGDIYQRTKLEAEEWIRAFASENNLSVAVIRPAAIYGPGDRRLLKLFKMAKRGWCPMLNHHDTRYHLIYVDDLVQGMLRCALHPAADGDVFICGNHTPSSLKDIVTAAAEELGSSVRFISLPAGPVFFVADVCEAICKRFHWNPPIYRRRVAFFTKDRAFDTSKIHTRIEFEESLDNTGGVRETARWYRDNHWL
ncbi:MAG: NAD-dependent epimerase/dehydratase family protein [Spartobacteria bacterium]|nr:NAD-dependent epimerase/dehydratase family protein [Spartobacteria bacterium]